LTWLTSEEKKGDYLKSSTPSAERGRKGALLSSTRKRGEIKGRYKCRKIQPLHDKGKKGGRAIFLLAERKMGLAKFLYDREKRVPTIKLCATVNEEERKNVAGKKGSEGLPSLTT